MRWEILDAKALRRNRDYHEGGRTPRRIEWHCSLRVRMKFRSLLQELVDLETWPATEEREMRMEALREEIRCLPGFPRRYDPERDLIVPVTSSVQR